MVPETARRTRRKPFALPAELRNRAFPWGVDNVQKTNELWLANKGEILKLPQQEQAAMMHTFVSLGTNIVARTPVVKAEMESFRRLSTPNGRSDFILSSLPSAACLL